MSDGDTDQWHLSRSLWQPPSTHGSCGSDVAKGSSRRGFPLTRLLLVQPMYIHPSPQVGFAHRFSARLVSLSHVLLELRCTHPVQSSRGSPRSVRQSQGVTSSRDGSGWVLVTSLPGRSGCKLSRPQGKVPSAQGPAHCNTAPLQSGVCGSETNVRCCLTSLDGLSRTCSVLCGAPHSVTEASSEEWSRYGIGYQSHRA
jgi:hypothetical protein